MNGALVAAGGTITALALLACALLASGFRKVDEALAPIDTPDDTPAAWPCGCGAMCESHTAAVEETRRKLWEHKDRIGAMLGVWTAADDELFRKLTDGAK